MTRLLSKSKLTAFRQCPRRVWLEVHKPELREDSSGSEARMEAGNELGRLARQIYDPQGKGETIDAQRDGFSQAFERSKTVLAEAKPVFEAGYTANGALAFAGCWVTANITMIALGYAPFDPPPFFWLQGLTSISGFLAAALVLIIQNRQGKLAERRAQLSFHLELVAERKVAKLIALVEELRRDLPSVHNRKDPEAEMMASSANPREVAAALENALDVAADAVGSADKKG